MDALGGLGEVEEEGAPEAGDEHSADPGGKFDREPAAHGFNPAQG